MIQKEKNPPSFIEFVLIISLMMSIGAFSMDAMLPALSEISTDFNVDSANHRQFVVSFFMLGIGIGQLIFGPMSDTTGRKPAVISGYLLYIVGAFTAVIAPSFQVLLAGRFLQGIGASAPRAITVAIVRDKYSGRKMARVMSFAMTVFILVPMIAPSLGQAILKFSDWRGIFFSFVVIALITIIWFGWRMPETLDEENRKPFSLRQIKTAAIQISKYRVTVGYTISAGLISGAFLGYLNSAQQIYQDQYGLGDRFPVYFSIIALSLGLASFLNARLVMQWGMRLLVKWSLWISLGLAVIALVISVPMSGNPPFWFLMSYLMLTFFCVGILFGNQNSLAMEPLGKLAGIGAALVGSVSTLIQVVFGTYIGQQYNGTIIPLILGLGILSLISLLIVAWVEAGSD